MEKQAALYFLDQEINARYDTLGKRRKLLDFIVVESSFIDGDCATIDSKVHVEGSYVFSPDLKLCITADGTWSYEGTLQKRKDQSNINRLIIEEGRKPSNINVEHTHRFSRYTIDAEIQTNKTDYFEALEKIIFGGNFKFIKGKLRINYLPNSSSFVLFDMFERIRLLESIGIIADFTGFGIDKQLNENQKRLEDEIAKLGLNRLTIGYKSMVNFWVSEKGDYTYFPVSTARYANADTGVGFEITFSPTKQYSWVVTISSDTPKGLQHVYNNKFSVPYLDGWEDDLSPEDRDHLVSHAYAEECHSEGKIKYILMDGETFLQTFLRWERALHTIKHGKLKALEAGVFENNE